MLSLPSIGTFCDLDPRSTEPRAEMEGRFSPFRARELQEIFQPARLIRSMLSIFPFNQAE